MAHRKSWSMETPVVLDGGPLGVADVVAVARRGAPVALGLEARRRLEAARAVVEDVIARGEVVYGVNTGFGELSRVHISDADLATLQQNLLRSHAAGVGEPLPDEVVRGMLLLLAASQARGHSGVRPVVPELVVEMLNRGVTPVVPARGSLGASGDLAPLAHIGLVLIGEGEAILDGERLPGRAALERAGLSPITLAAREGLAIINGTHLMAAIGALAIHDAHVLVESAEVAAAMLRHCGARAGQGRARAAQDRASPHSRRP